MAVDEKAVHVFGSESHLNPVRFLRAADGQRKVAFLHAHRVDARLSFRDAEIRTARKIEQLFF